MRCVSRLRAVAILCLLPILSANSNGAVITTPYGNFAGSTIIYQNVREASTAGALFGAPTLVADDTLVFSPTNFHSTLSSGPLTEIVDSQARFTVVAKPNEFIPQLKFSEKGVVSIDAPSTGFAMASVGTAIFYHIRAINGILIDGPSGGVNLPLTPSSGSFNTDDDGTLTNAPWSGFRTINFDSIIAATPGFSGRATQVEITFDNALATLNFGGRLASIRKNEVRISVPEASSGILMLAGTMLGGSLYWARRRS
ncbi:hypothetical protein K2X85_19620 [bacterium]|jgi:hypothetical protein|nr:hypothetical protein [bacterium]